MLRCEKAWVEKCYEYRARYQTSGVREACWDVVITYETHLLGIGILSGSVPVEKREIDINL